MIGFGSIVVVDLVNNVALLCAVGDDADWEISGVKVKVFLDFLHLHGDGFQDVVDVLVFLVEVGEGEVEFV